MLMADNFAIHQINDIFCDISGVTADPLDVARGGEAMETRGDELGRLAYLFANPTDHFIGFALDFVLNRHDFFGGGRVESRGGASILQQGFGLALRQLLRFLMLEGRLDFGFHVIKRNQ